MNGFRGRKNILRVLFSEFLSKDKIGHLSFIFYLAKEVENTGKYLKLCYVHMHCSYKIQNHPSFWTVYNTTCNTPNNPYTTVYRAQPDR